MELIYIDIPLWVKPILATCFVGWCWGMVKMSDLAETGCGWVGHQG